MEDPGAYLRSVVRVFPDWADTVIWFCMGPLDYADARISAPLAAAMAKWEKEYIDQLDVNLEWPPDAVSTEWHSEGERLARWLSNELGDAFEVEFGHDSPGGKSRIRGVGPGSNPEAVAALREIARADQEDHDEIMSRIRSGSGVGWTVYAPLTGAQLRPRRVFLRRWLRRRTGGRDA